MAVEAFVVAVAVEVLVVPVAVEAFAVAVDVPVFVFAVDVPVLDGAAVAVSVAAMHLDFVKSHFLDTQPTSL